MRYLLFPFKKEKEEEEEKGKLAVISQTFC
jgi:hypothetical protein